MIIFYLITNTLGGGPNPEYASFYTLSAIGIGASVTF